MTKENLGLVDLVSRAGSMQSCGWVKICLVALARERLDRPDAKGVSDLQIVRQRAVKTDTEAIQYGTCNYNTYTQTQTEFSC